MQTHQIVLTLSQLTCLYQFCFVMGRSVMCGFLGSYLGLRFGSLVLAMGDGWEMYSGSMADMPATGWWEGMLGGEDAGKAKVAV